MQPSIVTGTVEGTGSAINVSLGFTPDYVRVCNIDDAGSLYPIMEWWGDMPDGHGIKHLKTVDSGSTGNASHDKITSDGISAYAGDDTNEAGFTIGADSDLNVADETLVYTAMRNGPGGY